MPAGHHASRKTCGRKRGPARAPLPATTLDGTKAGSPKNQLRPATVTYNEDTGHKRPKTVRTHPRPA